MTSRARRAIPPLAAIIALTLFSGLGVWQLQRAAEKRDRLARIEAGARSEPAPLPTGEPALRRQAFARVEVRGRFLEDRQLLLDNRILDGRVGFDVLTPLATDDGRTVLVDRGWVPAGPDRRPVPSVALASAGPVEAVGRLWLPEPAVALGPALAPGQDWPRTVTRVDFAAIEEAVGRSLVPAVIRADGDADWIFRPRSLEPPFGPMRHYGYAFQWFALALTVIAVTAVLLYRRRGVTEE